MGCVYLLYDADGNGYIGKTTNIQNRIRTHKCSKINKTHSRYFDNFEYLVLEEFDDEDSMKVGEDFYIRLYKSLYGDKLLNKQIPLQSKKERYKKYKEQHKINCKKWRENNKHKIKECNENRREQIKEYRAKYNTQKIDCECGSNYCKTGKSAHIKTAKHQNFIQANQLE